MAKAETTIHLAPTMFGEREKPLVQHDSLSASTFRYASGVCGVRLKNELGELVMLPFQGQQIWSAQFGGRDLTMKSMFPEPRATSQYLETYGGFLLHCGATAMGVPTGEDRHPLHGELPNAPYQEAYLVLGEEDRKPYLGLAGRYQHTVAFTCNYVANPVVKLTAGSSLFTLSMTISNLRNTDMEWMYLAHANFRPIDNSRLVYSAPCDPQHVRVRKSIPAHVKVGPGFREFLADLECHPEKHNLLSPNLRFDPEVVFFLDYVADSDGWAHTMQVLPDGSADYMAHRPSQLEKGVRWITRTPDQAALGMILPATAEPEGYHAEKAKGNIKIIAPRSQVHFEYTMGTLNAAQASRIEANIRKLL